MNEKPNYFLYLKHNWKYTDYGGEFFTLKCNDCLYLIQERYIDNKYIITILDSDADLEIMHHHIDNFDGDYEKIKHFLLSCDEVMIKNIIE